MKVCTYVKANKIWPLQWHSEGGYWQGTGPTNYLIISTWRLPFLHNKCPYCYVVIMFTCMCILAWLCGIGSLWKKSCGFILIVPCQLLLSPSTLCHSKYIATYIQCSHFPSLPHSHLTVTTSVQSWGHKSTMGLLWIQITWFNPISLFNFRDLDTGAYSKLFLL